MGTIFKDHLFVQNAGMVLLAPYLPRLFTVLKLTALSTCCWIACPGVSD
jgi:hypothetical protein